MRRHTDADPGWAQFEDVVARLTEPVVRETSAMISESTGPLAKLVKETADDVHGLRAGQDAVVRQLKKLGDAVADSADLPDPAGPQTAELTEQVRQLRIEVGRLAGAVDHTLHGLIAELRERDAVLLARQHELCGSDTTPIGRMLSAGQDESAEPKVSRTARLTQVLALVSMVILVGVGVLAVLT